VSLASATVVALTTLATLAGCTAPQEFGGVEGAQEAQEAQEAGELASNASPFPTDGTGPLDALTRRFGRLRERMRGRGYDDEIGATRIFLLEGEGVALPIDLDAGRCTTFVGLSGGRVRELSISVFDGEGIEVVAAAVMGEGGLAHICPQAPPRRAGETIPHHLVVRSLEGSGAVVLGAFRTIPGAGEGFEGIFEGVLAPQVPFRDVEERLAERRTVLRERGFLPLGEPRLERVAEGDEVKVAFQLEPGRCYVAMARGDEGLRDVDLTLFDPAGAEVARNLEGDAEPEVELCPETSGRYGVSARAFEGAGALGLLVVGGPAPIEEEHTIEAEGGEGVEGTGEGGSGPEGEPVAAMSASVAALEARGYGAPSFIVPDGWVAPGEVRNHELVLGPGCFVVLGAAGRTETDLDLYLSRDGVTIDRDTSVAPTARVRICPRETTTVRVTVKAYGRAGPYALATQRAPAETVDVRALRLEEATAALRDRGFESAPLEVLHLEEGTAHRARLTIPVGRCVAVAVAGEEGVADVDVLLRDREGRLLASSSGPEAYAAVTRCAEDGTIAVVLEVVAYRGSGAVTLQRLDGTQ